MIVSRKGDRAMTRDIKFITDADGNCTAVILPIDEYEQLLEDLHLIRVYDESRESERIPWEQIKDELIAEGKSATK